MNRLKQFFTRNWLTKLFSLLLATLLWIMIANETSSEIGMIVPLEYRNIPPQLEITSDAANTIQVRLRGASSLVRDVAPRDISATLDLGGMGPGDRILQLSPQDIKTPVGIEVVRVTPARVRLSMDRTVTRAVPIEPRLDGAPAAGFVVVDRVATPSTIEVEGPENKVRGMASVSTAPIHLNGRQEDFSETVDIDVLDVAIRLKSPAGRVQVAVRIRPGDSGQTKRQHSSR